MWVAYYQRRWARLLVVSVLLVRAGFGMRPVATLRGAWHVLRANQLWAPFPDNDADGARHHMERFYRLLDTEPGTEVDPTVAARLEVEWWLPIGLSRGTPATKGRPRTTSHVRWRIRCLRL